MKINGNYIGRAEEIKSVEGEILNGLSIFNGDMADFLGKKNNIWLGVSISLKPYSEKLARQYLELIARHSREQVLIFIADEVAAINYKILGGYSSGKSFRKAIDKGNLFVEKYNNLIKTLSPEIQKKIKVVRWGNAWTEKQERMYQIIKEEYLANLEFKKEVEAPIITYLENSNRTVKASRVVKMSEYILRELPFLLDGVEHEGINYKTLLYPTYGKTSLSEVVTKIQRGEVFEELKAKLDLEGDHMLVDSPISGNKEDGTLETS